MAVRLGAERNELHLADNLSGQAVALYYRMPTTGERMAYQNGCLVREGKKLVNRTAEMRAEYGRRILAGIRDGDFERPDGSGGWAPLSSDPGSAHYSADWKETVAEHAGHLVDTLAYVVFEAGCRVDQPEAPGDADPN